MTDILVEGRRLAPLLFNIPGKQSGSKPDLWRAYKLGLDVQSAQIKRRIVATHIAWDEKIDQLLNAENAGRSWTELWEDLYEAEQRLALFLSDAEVRAEATRRFVEANKLGVPTAAALKTVYDAAQSAEDRLAAYARLLDDLHFGYIKRALDRKTRKEMTSRLNILGIWIILPLLISILIALITNQTPAIIKYHAIEAIYFGVIGAYLSRMYVFQGSADTLDYDALQAAFPLRTIFVRLIIGVIGALMMYLLIVGGLLGGELFPDLTKGPMWTDIPISMPSAAFAKLLIWSTIAGFSEQFVPDQFTSFTAKATPAPAKPAPDPGNPTR